jgi:hypothetical protein
MFRRGWRKSRKHEYSNEEFEGWFDDAPAPELRIVADLDDEVEVDETLDDQVAIDPAIAAIIERLDRALADLTSTCDRLGILVATSLEEWVEASEPLAA